MRNAVKNSYVEPNLVRKLQSKVGQFLPGLSVSLSKTLRGPASRFDLYAKDESGKEYFIEVKARACHRVVIGQIIEQAASVLEERPDAKILLICSSIDPAVKDMLSKAGIETMTFTDFGLDVPVKHKPPKARLGLSPTEQQGYFALVRMEKKVVSTRDFALLMNIPMQRAKNLLVALNRHGVIFRLGKGKYAVLPPDVLYQRKSYTADPYVVIDSLMHGLEYYVAYSSAAHLHGIITQLPFTVFVATLNQRRPISLGKTEIRYITIKKRRLFGTEKKDYFGSLLVVSDLERTIVDCFDRLDLIGGVDEAGRITAESLDKLDFGRLADYAKRMEKKVLVQRLGFVLEKLHGAGYKIHENTLNRLERMVEDKFTYPLDPKVKRKGKLSYRWRIYENVDCLRWHYA